MIGATQGRPLRQVRTLFLSDVHLGCRHAQTDAVLGLLQSLQPRRVYLVGDFLDAWRLKRNWRWNSGCDAVIRHLLQWADEGVRIHYAPGNHDAFLRAGGEYLTPWTRGGQIVIRDEFVCTLADGRRLAVLHGDQFDPIECRARWLSVCSSFGYDQILSLNWWMSRWGSAAGRSPYRLCAQLKFLAKRSIFFMQRFEDRVFDYARGRGLDGVVCGHLHTPRTVVRDGLTYCNVGDWIENCAAVVETPEGELQHVRCFGGPLPAGPGSERTSAAVRPSRRGTMRPARSPAGLEAAGVG